MARPRRTVQPVIHQVKLVLIPGEDDDLIRLLSDVPARRKATVVKTAIRSGGSFAAVDAGANDDEILDALGGFLL